VVISTWRDNAGVQFYKRVGTLLRHKHDYSVLHEKTVTRRVLICRFCVYAGTQQPEAKSGERRMRRKRRHHRVDAPPRKGRVLGHLLRHPEPRPAGLKRPAQAGHHHHCPHSERPAVRAVQGVQQLRLLLHAQPPSSPPAGRGRRARRKQSW
jgi:hypothetical protein